MKTNSRRKFFNRISPGRIIAVGFLTVILIGSLLLLMPFSIRKGADITYIDALYTSTSAVCVTGLTTVDVGNVFTPFGQFVLALLIQIGGLGVASVGAGIVLAVGQKIGLKGRSLIGEAMNVSSRKGIVRLLRSVLFITLIFELLGAILSFFVFIQHYPLPKAIGISLFHSVAAFNNSGFDIFGNYQSLTAYQDNVWLNLVTCGLIIFGGLGFWVIRELWDKKCRWKKMSMHTKVVVSVSAVLILAGTLLLKLTEDITWLGAFFHSVSVRTAGFATYSLGTFSNAGLLAIMLLMIIGASPGSTGGGIKTTTFFVLIQGIKKAATNRKPRAFRYSVPKRSFEKATVITLIACGVILVGTFAMAMMEPHLSLRDVLFEMTSAFGTVGLSTGITPDLGVGSKLLSILIMYIGRLGPLTVATLWYFGSGENVQYPEGNIIVG